MFTKENLIFFGVIAGLVGISLLFSSIAHGYTAVGDIPPTRAFSKIISGNNTIQANKYNANLTISPGTGITIEVFSANNTLKINANNSTNSTGYVTTAANVGTGTGEVFRDKTSTTLNFKTIKAGSNISITNNANDITISSNASSSGITKANNLDGGDAKIFATNSSTQVTAKTLTAGTGISITNGTKTITITATGTSGFTNLYGYPGGDARIIRSNASNTAVFKSLTSGAGISITNGTDSLIITNTRTTESTTGSNLGSSGTGIFSALVGFDLQFKKLISSTLSITSNSTNVIIDTISSGFTKLNSLNGGTASIVATNQSNQATFKTLTQGTGITITNGTNTITIASTITQGITKANNLDGGDAKIFATNSSTQVTAKTITAGTGITITNGTKTITIATSGGSINTLAANTTLTASVSADTAIFTIPLTANSGNSIQGILDGLSSVSGNAIRGAANVTNLGTRGFCHWTQVSTTSADSIDNLVLNTVLTGRATNTGETAWIANANVPMPIMFECAVVTGATPGNLKIWVTPEATGATQVIKAGSYYVKSP